jgi:hypothetical protein
MFDGVKFEVSRLYLSFFCLLPSALCLPPTKITKSCQEPKSGASCTFNTSDYQLHEEIYIG